MRVSRRGKNLKLIVDDDVAEGITLLKTLQYLWNAWRHLEKKKKKKVLREKKQIASNVSMFLCLFLSAVLFKFVRELIEKSLLRPNPPLISLYNQWLCIFKGPTWRKNVCPLVLWGHKGHNTPYHVNTTEQIALIYLWFIPLQTCPTQDQHSLAESYNPLVYF